MAARYLKQIIVIDKSLHMPTGKVAAMAAHAAMTFIIEALRPRLDHGQHDVILQSLFTDDEIRWLTELDPGIESTQQVSMAKIVCEVKGEAELLAVEKEAKDAGLTTHRVIDSGYSHNKPGTFAAIAIGPHWPELLEPVTLKLKIYR